MTRGLLLLVVGVALAGTARAEESLVSRNAVWKYLATPTAPDPEWKTLEFDDGTWPQGPGALGYNDPFIVTTVPYGGNDADKWETTYFRHAFVLAPGFSFTTMRLEANYDDGFVAYLNGVEIARRGFPAGPVGYESLASIHEGGAYEMVDVSAYVSFLQEGANVLAVEVHQQAVNSSDLAWDGALLASLVPEITRGPYLQVGTPHSVKVRWRTNAPTTSLVRYGLVSGSPSDFVFDSTPTTEHEVTIPGLSPEQRYYYAVGYDDTLIAGDPSCFVQTPPLSGVVRPTRAWILGDAGRASLGQMQVRDAYEAFTGSRHTDLWLMLGDNAYDTGTDFEYQRGLFDIYPAMLRKSVLWPTRGNHDFIHAGPANDYYEFFTMPMAAEAGGVASGTEAYYSFDWSNIHFICMDSEGTDRTLGGAMIQWLRQDLAATDAMWIVAFWHHPAYTKGSHDSDNPGDSGGRMKDMRERVLPILDSTGVDLVLTGHSHSYERSFLLNGHYGVSTSLTPVMIVDGGDGRLDGDGAYSKPSVEQGPFEGAIHAVAGSSGQISGGTLNHPVMVSSLNVLGSLVLDVEGPRLDARFVDNTGAILDSFTISKGGVLGAPTTDARPSLRLTLAGANPTPGSSVLRFAIPSLGRTRLTVVDPAGRRVATLVNGAMDAGTHEISWSGTDSRRRVLPAGVYFAVLEHGGERRVVKLVRGV